MSEQDFRVKKGFDVDGDINFTGNLYQNGSLFSSGTGLSNRVIRSGITTEIPENGIGTIEIFGFKTYGIIKVELSTAGWLRLYTDSASRSADASRSVGIDPVPGSGVIADVITTFSSTSQIITPPVIGTNLDDPIQPIIYASVNNFSGIQTSIAVHLTIIQMES